MEDKKICNTCQNELPIDRFGIIKKGNKEYIRNVCKTCHNDQAKEKRRDKPYKINTSKDKGFIVDGNQKPQYKVEKRNTKMSNIFTSQEIESLKNIAKYNNELMAILNNRINFEKIEDIKIKKSISISKLHHEKILELVKNTDKNYSQIVDSLLQKGLDNI